MSNIHSGSKNYFHLNGKVNPLTEIMNAGISTSGNVYWVKDPSDADYLEFKDSVGKENLFDTIQPALDKCTTDENDYVLVCPKVGGSAYDLGGEGLNMSKDKVHLIGVGASPNNTDYGVVVEGFGTAGTCDAYGLLYVTGKGVEVAGMKFSSTAGTASGGSTDTGGACMSLYGDAPYIHDCTVEMSSGNWDAGTPDGAISVGSAIDGGLLENMEIRFGTKTAQGTTAGVFFNFNNERWHIKDSRFKQFAPDAQDSAIRLAPGTVVGMGDVLTVENCQFLNYNSGTAWAVAISGTAASGSLVSVVDCKAMGATTIAGALVNIAPAFGGGTINNLLQNPGIAIPGTALIVTKT